MTHPSGDNASPEPAPSSTGRDDDRPSENPAPARGNETGAWQAPWVASPGHPAGAANAPVPPQQATGHYGAGYEDPTPHFGNTLPGRPDIEAPGEGGPTGPTATASSARAAEDDAAGSGTSTRTTASPAEAGAARGERAIGEQRAPRDAQHATDDPERAPDFTPEEVGMRPPDRAPSEEAPASENAGLIFERS